MRFGENKMGFLNNKIEKKKETYSFKLIFYREFN